jgi:6-phosphogluconate dehydrogenase
MTENTCRVGMIGLGVMGRNMVLNIADHGFSVAGYDKDLEKVERLAEEAGNLPVRTAKGLEEFVGLLEKPRTVMLLVPAGAPVDAVLRELLPHLQAGDVVADCGNSHFKDTDVRARTLTQSGIQYLGIGVSGGEEGARRGPSIMPGGPRNAYDRIGDVLEAVAAHVDGTPCVAYLGPGSAGHYVKMVHNGIEYALMCQIAETYDLMKRGLGLDDDELHDVFLDWSQGEAAGYLLEITAKIFEEKDSETGKRLIDVLLDVAKQLGTGKWSSEDAIDIGVPTPSIDIAVTARSLSAKKDQREAASKRLSGPPAKFEGDRDAFVKDLGDALLAGMVVAYAQGMAQLAGASHHYGYDLDLETIATIWRGGCIIRARLLEDIRSAYAADPTLDDLLMSERLGRFVESRQTQLRNVVGTAAKLGIPTMGLAVALGYYDSYRSAWLPANLVQAQRDYFGAHTYERIDQKGVFHTHWEAD